MLNPGSTAMNRVAASVLILVAVSAPDRAHANQFDRCMSNAGGVTAAMLDCIGREQAAADRRLPETLRNALDRLSAERAHALSTTQAAWRAYREAHCNFIADRDGGTAATLMAADCWLSLTRDRVAFLESLIESDTVLLR